MDQNNNTQENRPKVTEADRANIRGILENIQKDDTQAPDALTSELLSQFTHKAVTSGIDMFSLDVSTDEKEQELPTYIRPESKIRCKNCGDKGFYIVKGTTVKCTDCSTYKKVHGTASEKLDNKLKELNIPEYYLTHEFDTKKIHDGKTREEQQHDNYDIYRANLRMLYDTFTKGGLPKTSYFVAAPIGYGKNHFVYSSMKTLSEYGLDIPPYLDTEELLELRLTNPLAFQEHIKSPILFIKILVAYTEVEDVEMMRYIVEKRGRMNLPTVVLSRYNYNYLSRLEPHLESLFVEKEYSGLYTRLTRVESPFLADYDRYREERIERNNARKRFIENPAHTDEEHERYLKESPKVQHRSTKY